MTLAEQKMWTDLQAQVIAGWRDEVEDAQRQVADAERALTSARRFLKYCEEGLAQEIAESESGEGA